jgi:hypothetical protein
MIAGDQLLRVALIQVIAVLLTPYGAAALLERRGIPAHLAVAAGLIVGPVAALGVFWMAWLDLPRQSGGLVAGWALFPLGPCLSIWAIAAGQWRSEIVPPFLLAGAAALVLLVWTYAGHLDAGDLMRVPATRWTHSLPGDNTIPLNFAQGLFAGHIPSPMHSNWLSSDRPPLQTALYLATPDWLRHGPRDFGYEPAAVAMQTLVLIGAWALLRALGVGRSMALAGMVAVFFTPLVIVNGTYVWPKLLATAFLLAAAAIHLSPDYGTVKHRLGWGIVTGALCALAMLSHGGSAFVIVGVGIAALAIRRLATVRYVAGAALAFVVLYSPWIAYQKFADPPGDGLLKMHLAGASNVDPRPLSRAIIDSYRELTPLVVAKIRASNTLFLVAHTGRTYAHTLRAVKAVLTGNVEAARLTLAETRIDQFFHFVAGSGLLGLGFFLLPLGCFDRNLRPLAVCVIATLASWIAIMYGPGATAIHQGSLFPEIAILVGVLVALPLRPRLAAPLIGAHVATTAFQYAV